MKNESNALGQPVGEWVASWKSAAEPGRTTLCGRFCTLEPLNVSAHAKGLFAANQLAKDGAPWTYLPYGPFANFSEYQSWLSQKQDSADRFLVILDARDQTPVGIAAYMRIDQTNGVVEVGHLNFSPLLQRQPAATEAMFLMMAHVFDCGFRRYEWKCHAMNEPSRKAAERLGFTFEGEFRQSLVTKGRNRDTRWYSIIDTEWPHLRQGFLRWLAPENFDAAGKQKQSLRAFHRKPLWADKQIVLRKAGIHDVEGIVRLANAGGPNGPRQALPSPLPEVYFSAFERINSDARQCLIVAEQAGQIVGSLHLNFLTYLLAAGQDVCLVEQVHVAEAARGQGIGRKMMEWAISEAKNRHCWRVQLTTDKTRKEAHRFYERLGFVFSHEGAKLNL